MALKLRKSLYNKDLQRKCIKVKISVDKCRKVCYNVYNKMRNGDKKMTYKEMMKNGTKEQKEITKILRERAENPKKYGKKIPKELKKRIDNFYKGNI